jgi:membrane protease YdiL (CAAX protease family)
VIAQYDAYTSESLIAAACLSGLLALVYLLAREFRKKPLLVPNPRPFEEFDPGGYVLIALSVFFGYMLCTLLVSSSGKLGLAAGLGGILLGILIAAGAYRFAVRRVMRPRGTIAARIGVGLIVLWAALPIVFGLYLVIQLLRGPGLQREVIRIMRAEEGWQVVAVFAVLVAPVVEEILFRGLLYPWIRRFAGPRVALVITAVLFGLVHQPPETIAPLAIFGIFLAYLVETTGSLLPSIVAHAVFNALTVGQLLLA